MNKEQKLLLLGISSILAGFIAYILLNQSYRAISTSLLIMGGYAIGILFVRIGDKK